MRDVRLEQRRSTGPPLAVNEMAACLNWKNEHAPTRLVDPDVEAAAATIARAAMVAGYVREMYPCDGSACPAAT